MAAPALPTPWPGATTAPTVRGTAANQSVLAQGVMSGNTTHTTNEVPQVQKGLVWWNPGVASLTRLMSKMKGGITVKNYEHKLLEKQALPRTATIASITGTATTATALKFAANEAYRFRVGDLLKNLATGDIALVTAVSDDDDVVVTSNIGNGSASGTLWAATNVVLQIGNAQIDGADAGAPVHVIEDEKSFYTQIFYDIKKLTRRYENTELFEGNAWTNMRKEAETEHLKSIEYARFFGKKSITQDSTTGRLRTTMAGLQSLVTTNQIDLASNTTFTKDFFDSVLVEAMRQGHNGFDNAEMANKTLICSHKIANVIGKFPDSAIRVMDPSEKTFGLRIAQYQGSWGVLNIINAPVLNQAGTINGMGFILDLAHIKPLTHAGGATRWEDNVQSPAALNERHEAGYVSDVGIVLELDAAHTFIYGLA